MATSRTSRNCSNFMTIFRLMEMRIGVAHPATADAVHRARRLGIPWDGIADRVGMTRQALAKRFS